METRVKEDKLSFLLQMSLPGWRFEANYSQSSLNGRIVLVWNPSLSVITYHKNDQCVLCGVHNHAFNKSFIVAFASRLSMASPMGFFGATCLFILNFRLFLVSIG